MSQSDIILASMRCPDYLITVHISSLCIDASHNYSVKRVRTFPTNYSFSIKCKSCDLKNVYVTFMGLTLKLCKISELAKLNELKLG